MIPKELVLIEALINEEGNFCKLHSEKPGQKLSSWNSDQFYALSTDLNPSKSTKNRKKKLKPEPILPRLRLPSVLPVIAKSPSPKMTKTSLTPIDDYYEKQLFSIKPRTFSNNQPNDIKPPLPPIASINNRSRSLSYPEQFSEFSNFNFSIPNSTPSYPASYYNKFFLTNTKPLEKGPNLREIIRNPQKSNADILKYNIQDFIKKIRFSIIKSRF